MNGRRKFLQQSSVLAGGVLTPPLILPSLHRQRSQDKILKCALVGCGGRGSGAAAQILSADKNVHLVAMADLFEDQLKKSYEALEEIEEIEDQLIVGDSRKFVGFDAYRKATDEADIVILATPPAFRPAHFEYAVEKDKHVFMEKPLSCDSPGTRRILKAGESAEKKNLKIVVGLQNRYDPGYQEMIQQIQSGIIGDVVSAVCYYMKGSYPIIPREKTSGELAFQIKNWHFFNWMWGGATAGLQIHNDDIVHWIKNSYPINAQGFGGRISSIHEGMGDSYDSFYLEYEYEDGSILHSEIRTIDHTLQKNGAWIRGTKGVANISEGIRSYDGEILWKREKNKFENPYQLEQDRFIEAIRKDEPLNDTETGAFSSHAANMGRMAAETGRMATWDESLNSDHVLAPEITDWGQQAPILPGEDGRYPMPRQGDAG